MAEFDLAIVGAGLAGCSLAGRLAQLNSPFNIVVIEAGRGPGGRTASRRRRDDINWRVDHGAPGFSLSKPLPPDVETLLEPLRISGTLQRDSRPVIGVDEQGGVVPATGAAAPTGGWWHGVPCMASICEQLLPMDPGLKTQFGTRVRWLDHRDGLWWLADENRGWSISARRLVLSGSLLAHPRSLAMLAWSDVPLRSAVRAGVDPQLDEVLHHLQNSQSAVRWNLMLDLGHVNSDQQDLPRQIWLTEAARKRWQVERLVVHLQSDGRIALVVHGLDGGEAITPESQPALMKQKERELQHCLPELLRCIPALQHALTKSTSLGVMRWGASQPLDHPLPTRLQWCSSSAVGFCGDWIEGPGFGTAEAAIRSGVELAERLQDAS